MFYKLVISLTGALMWKTPLIWFSKQIEAINYLHIA